MKVRLVLLMWMCGLSQATNTGHPAGYMSDCPGMNHATTLSEETKRSLSMLVVFRTNEFLLPYEEVKCQLDDTECVVKRVNFRNVTQVFVGGYLDVTFSPLVRSFIAEYLEMDRNVLVLEIFSALVRSYPTAARLTKPIGTLLGQFLVALTRRGLSPRRLELVGSSLGAHIASYAAVEYFRQTGQRPARLTGLDPAGPCFRNLPVKARLHADVAEKVDVLHTNIDGFGIAEPLGHVDFYANGGEFQPSIKGNFILPCFLYCSHARAGLYYYLAYKNPNEFIAVKCASVAETRIGHCYDGKLKTNILGPNTDFNKTGIYYLPTSAIPPFYLGLNGLKKRKYGVNDYLLMSVNASDEDFTI